MTRRKRSSGKRRASSSSSGGHGFRNRLLGVAAGGAGYGFLVKNFGDKIPKLPFIGRSGTIALASYFFAGKHPFIQDVGIAAAAIAGFTFATDGVINGDDDDVIATQF